jgi:hypothetical protein
MASGSTFNSRHLLVAASPFFALLCVALIVTSALEFFQLQAQDRETREASYATSTQEAANELGQRMIRVAQEAETLAAKLSAETLSPAEYEQALAAMIQSNPMFYGGAIAFAPFAYDPQSRLYGIYYAKMDDGLKLMHIEDSYDYTADDQEWFGKALTEGSRWSTPYFDKSLGDILMTTYSAVVYRPSASGQRQAIAVVTIDISIESLGNIVKTFGVGSTGYPEIITDQGLYLYTPTESRVLNRESLFDSAAFEHDKDFEQLRELIGKRRSGIIKLLDPTHDEHHLVSVAPVPTAPWLVIGNFTDAEVVSRTPELRHLLMRLILGTVLLLCFALLYKQVSPDPEAIVSWPTSVLVTAILIIGVSQIWRVSLDYPSDRDRRTFPVTSEQAVTRELSLYTLRAKEHLTAPPLAIPTGIYIESMKFISNSDLQVVGAIWQKYDLERDKDVERGVVFPGAGRLLLSRPIIERDQNTELIRWQFSGEWRFRNDFARFPLMQDVFGIGLLPQDSANNILLVPDVDSYAYLAPSELPALSPNVFLLGWRIASTYFELRPWQHATTFGKPASLKDEALPELYFSAKMERAFVNSLISNLTPLAIAMIITFIVLLISTRDQKLMEVLRTGVGFDIGICTSIFFVVVLSHIGLRNTVMSDEVFYLEYFYLLMYLNLIWVCFRSILTGLNHPVLDKWTFGISARKVYFPANFAAIFVVTWFIFYK